MAKPKLYRRRLRSPVTIVRELLPQGRLLPDHLWRRRHRAIVILLWLHVPALFSFGLAMGVSSGLAALEVSFIGGLAAIATAPFVSRRLRSTAAAFGLVTCSAVFVHLWEGQSEAHFHFFVVVAVLMLYQEWTTFLIAIGYVAFHNGLVGWLDPELVYDDPAAVEHPFLFALLHAGFVLAASAANMVAWRANEQLLRDPLTGLASRTVLSERLRIALDRSRRNRLMTAVLFIDIDRFKLVNDSLGHSAGDRLLVVLADRLRGAIRRTDTAVRFGGDEFVVLCEEVRDARAALQVAERVADSLRAPVMTGGHELTMTVSIGIALSAGDVRDPEDLVRDADAAMYRAKQAGRSRCELFDDEMRERVLHQLAVEHDLRRAIERDELVLHYQPEVDLPSGTVAGVEALVRWRHPERGLIAPDDFIPVAEETGQIVGIGEWVLMEACRQGAAWKARRGSRELVMRVNVSPRQLDDPGFVDAVARALADSGLEPRDLCLEITESALIRDLDRGSEVLRRVRALGVLLALDDFGTGHSSLTYLRRLRVDVLKIDREFLRGLDSREDDQAIVAAIIGMARALGLTVTAEGVERQSQLAKLHELRCDAAQGFLLARPALPAEIEPMLGLKPDTHLRAVS